jgi:hypothetical protein
MTELTIADLIWNRACLGAQSFLLPGDRALAAMLVFHGAAMNGGVLDALECMAPEDVLAAELGYRYFGLDEIADLLNEAKSIFKVDGDMDASEAEFNRRYSLFVPDDSALIQRFELILQRTPSDFAPL